MPRATQPIPQMLLHGARYRAKKHHIPCTIALKDIIVPDFCPIFGIKLERNVGKVKGGRGAASNASPTLDRFIPKMGYVPGNVAVISAKANRLKNNSTVDELEAVARWMRQRTS